MPSKRMLAYITGSVNDDLLRRIEYLLEEIRLLETARLAMAGTLVLGAWPMIR